MTRRTRSSIVALAVAGLLSSGAAFAEDRAAPPPDAKGGQPSGDTQAGNTPSGQARSDAGQGRQSERSQDAPAGFILVEEHVVLLTANAPQNHFLRASQLLSQDPKAAAGEVNVAAAYLDMQASRAKDSSGGPLSSAADRLRSLAGQLRKGGGDAQQQQQQLTQAFASANHSLAQHFQKMADKAVSAKRDVAAGYDLNAAADSLTAAFAWSKKEAPQDAISAIADARRVAGTLVAADADRSSTPAQATGRQGDAQSTDRAQTAGSRQGGDPARTDRGSSGGQMPADASKAVDQLGKAIQQSAGQFQTSGGAQPRQPGEKASGASSGDDKSGGETTSGAQPGDNKSGGTTPDAKQPQPK